MALNVMDSPEVRRQGVETLCEEVKNDICADIINKVDTMMQLWLEIGIGSDAIRSRLARTKTHVLRLLSGMYEEELELKSRIISSVEKSTEVALALAKQLAMPCDLPPEELPILDRQMRIRELVEEFHHIKGLRKKEARKLRAAEAEQCRSMATDPHVVSSGVSLLSKGDLLQLSHRVTTRRQEKLKQQLERYERMKKERVKELIDRTKDDLLTSYSKCCVPELKASFEKDEDSEDSSDQRLEELKEELRRLKEFHAKNELILAKAERREALWARFLELEKRAADPSRLNNRGGRLLLEMRERKRLEKELPRLEEEIKTYIRRRTGSEEQGFFNEWARNFLEHLSGQHEAYSQEKDRERQQRENRRKEPCTPTSQRSVMRRGPSGTPSSAASRFSRLGGSTANTLTPSMASRSTTAGKSGLGQRSGTPMRTAPTAKNIRRRSIKSAAQENRRKEPCTPTSQHSVMRRGPPGTTSSAASKFSRLGGSTANTLTPSMASRSTTAGKSGLGQRSGTPMQTAPTAKNIRRRSIKSAAQGSRQPRRLLLSGSAKASQSVARAVGGPTSADSFARYLNRQSKDLLTSSILGQLRAAPCQES